MTSSNETKVTADLRRKLTATTAFINVLRNIHASRAALIEAVEELDSDTDAFDADEFDGGSEVRRSLKDAIIANNKATLAVEENVFEGLEEAIDNAGDEADYIDSAAEDSTVTIAAQTTTITDQTTKIEELTGELEEANGVIEAFTAPGAEVLHVDTLIIAEIYVFGDAEDETEAGAGEGGEAGAGEGGEAEAGAGNGDEAGAGAGEGGEAEASAVNGEGDQPSVEAPVEE